MGNYTKKYYLTAAIYGFLALLVGLYMAITQDHSQLTTHAHFVLIGWVSFFLFALFYQQYEEKLDTKMVGCHFWLSQISLIGLVTGLGLIYGGMMEYEFIAAISSIGYTLSFLTFLINVIKVTK